ncbi:MAG TPA: FtsX-like permease family protein [Rhodanobacter sp.]
MSIRILFDTLRRHSLMPLLVLLQVTMACAILCNVLFLVWQQLEPMLASSGVAENELILIDQLSLPDREWTAAEVHAGEIALRQVPGVRAASASGGLPMVLTDLYIMALKGDSGATVGVNAYNGEGLVKTLGVRLVAGRDFLADEYKDPDVKSSSQSIIITQALAEKLFKPGHALGGMLTDSEIGASKGFRVVGIVRHLMRNQIGMTSDGRADNTVMLAQRVGSTSRLAYAIRVDPAMRDAALTDVKKVIQRQFGVLMDTSSTAHVSFYSERRDEAFQDRRAALGLFAGVTLMVVIVTVIGIMGLTGFWVQKRTRQIGIRRALGARRGDILRYFLVENALIVGIGVALGMLLAYLGNRLLMQQYELKSLPWMFLPLGAVLMLVLGQIAVLAPARRAASVPPVVATRSV